MGMFANLPIVAAQRAYGMRATCVPNCRNAHRQRPATKVVCNNAVSFMTTTMTKADQVAAHYDAMFDTLQTLANLDDPIAALRSLLRGLCAEVDAPLAVLAVKDAPRQLMRITSVHGTRSGEMIGLEFPVGTGLLGKVCVTGRTQVLVDYAGSVVLERVPELDGAAIGEELVSALSVPISARGRTLAALMVGSRSQREWNASEITTTERYAAAIAVVIRHYFTDRGEPSGEAPGAWHRFINARRWEAIHGEKPGEFWDALENRLGASVTFLTADGGIEGHRLPKSAVTDAWKLSAGFDRAVLTRETCTVEFDDQIAWLHRVDVQDTLHGVLSIWKPRGTAPLSHYQLADCAFVTSLYLTIDRLHTIAAQRWELLLLEQLLSGSSEDATDRLERYGLREDEPCTVVCIDVAESALQRAQRLVAREIRYQRPLIALHRSHVCIVLPGSINTERLEQLSSVLTEHGIDALIAAEEASTGPTQLRQAHEVARTLNYSQRALGRDSGVATTSVFGITGLLFSATNSSLLNRIVRSRLGRLIDYDAERGTDLELTAWTYLAGGRQAAAAAKQLHIHQNTLRQRLERIDELLGNTEWREAPYSYEMFLALEARRLTRGANSSGRN